MNKVEKIYGKYKVTAGKNCICGFVVEYSKFCNDKKEIPTIQHQLNARVQEDYIEHLDSKQHIRVLKFNRILK